MYRQSPSRNQRSKGIKVKYIVQICLLLAICFWLIYQVKHSHDKKKEFEEIEAKNALGIKKNVEEKPINLGRKGTLPLDGDTISKNENTSIEEDEIVEEEDESKPEEEENNKPEEEDEPEEKNIEHDAEVDREEDSADENENQEVGSEDGHGQAEIESSSDGDDNKSVNEAREEHYKADDASSAVTHDNTENENVKEGNKQGNKTEETDKTKVDVLDSSENGLPSNNTVIEGSNRDLTSNNSSAEVEIETGANVLDSNMAETAETKDDELRSEDLSKLSNNNNNNTESLSSKKNDEIETEKSDRSDGTYEKLEITGTENPEEESQHDDIDVSDTLEEKHVRTDRDTLPEIQTEGPNSEDDVSAE
ncbi:hypothetical protein CASFOL_042467 [Castilleja foliolosa]|uniref:Uncharacterized protein n=1 Tax=Castilleja foliolosa TaxID=1961234 RepID=A0ABD3BAH9_9LAMI